MTHHVETRVVPMDEHKSYISFQGVCSCGERTSSGFIHEKSAREAAFVHILKLQEVEMVMETLEESPSVDTSFLQLFPGNEIGEVFIKNGHNPIRLMVHSQMDLENLVDLISTFKKLFWS